MAGDDKDYKVSALSNEHVHMVVSLAPTLSKLTDFPDAGKSNAWLKGSVTRVTNPTTDITDAEISKKQVIAGVNYDPRTLGTVVLGLSPDQGCNVEASISLIPVAHEQWTFAATRNSHAWEISEAAAACGPRDPGVFREETKEAPRSVSLQLPFIPETGLTFRFQAHYDLSIETSGVDEGTPFAVYARGKLDNVHFELMPGDMMGAVPMWEPLHTFMGNSDCRCLAFDYDGKKKLDHVIAYVPGDPRNLIFSYGSDGQVRFAQRRMVWKAHSDYLQTAPIEPLLLTLMAPANWTICCFTVLLRAELRFSREAVSERSSRFMTMRAKAKLCRSCLCL